MEKNRLDGQQRGASRTTVKDLINELKKYPEDMIVAADYDIFSDIELEVKIWTHTNYPYDKPDVEFLNLQ